MTKIKVIVEKYLDGYVAYPIGIKGVVVGQGESYQGSLADLQSAIEFHVGTFGTGILIDEDCTILDAFVAEIHLPPLSETYS